MTTVRSVTDLKTWPEFFEATVRGTKPFEVRQDDRGDLFDVGRRVHLREWDGDDYTGRHAYMRITYKLSLTEVPGLHVPGYCVLGLEFIHACDDATHGGMTEWLAQTEAQLQDAFREDPDA